MGSTVRFMYAGRMRSDVAELRVNSGSLAIYMRRHAGEQHTRNVTYSKCMHQRVKIVGSLLQQRTGLDARISTTRPFAPPVRTIGPT